MRMLVRLLTVGALFGVVAVGAASASHASTPTLIPTFSISITGVPGTIARGEVVTAHTTITNLTESAAVAQGTWQVVPPKATARSAPLTGHFSLTVPAGQTVTKNFTFKVPLRAMLGTYTLTVSVVGATAPAIVTFAVT